MALFASCDGGGFVGEAETICGDCECAEWGWGSESVAGEYEGGGFCGEDDGLRGAPEDWMGWDSGVVFFFLFCVCVWGKGWMMMIML